MGFLVTKMEILSHQMILSDLTLEGPSVVIPYEWQAFLEERKPFAARNGPILTLRFARSKRLFSIGIVVERDISPLILS